MNYIPDLSERFIYANDDMFPIGELSVEGFFREDGKLIINYEQREDATNPFQVMCERINRLASELAGLRVNHGYKLPFHFFAPMVKSVNQSVVKRLGEKIPESVSRFRVPENINQYIYQDYYVYSDMSVTDMTAYRVKRITFNHPCQTDEIAGDILSGKYDMYCINDEYWWTPIEPELVKIRVAFRKLFPRKCRFEK